MKLCVTLFLLIPVASAQFYVKDQQYRFRAGDPRCDVNKFCEFEKHISGDGHDFSINFVEVRGNGSFWDSEQLENSVARLKEATDGGRQTPLVFIYIHGWHNNAAELENPATQSCPDLNGDVAKFRDCGLPELARNYPTVMGAPPAVVGVYLAWQGMDFGPPSLVMYIVPSYMLRRYGATRVGMTGMCRAVTTILDTVRADREHYVVALMGHSFGARVLENASEKVDPDRNCQGILKQHRDQLVSLQAQALKSSVEPAEVENRRLQPAALSRERAPADVIFYVNAAASNAVTRRTIKDWKSICAADETKDNPVCPYNPLYLAATSHTDVATGPVMFFANLAFFWYPTSLKPLQFELVPLSAANSPWMHTHHDPKNLKTQPCPKPDDEPNGICFQVPVASSGPNNHSDTYDVKPIENVPERFWIMNTGQNFIRNHGDVWNLKVFGMVEAAIQRNEHYVAARKANLLAK
jgi:pimeloyl-ACP methyl ester carboxylesterase